MLSIIKEHIQWIGKSGKPFELGIPVCAVKDGNGFVLGHEIVWKGGDAYIAISPPIKGYREAFPDLRARSFDRGFLCLSRHLTAR